MNKIMNRKDFTNLTDRELVEIRQTSPSLEMRNLAGDTLFIRYERQIHKHWQKLCNQLNRIPAVYAVQEDYYDEAMEAFLKAIEKTDLSRIKDDNWKFVSMLNWYLSNVRTKIIRLINKRGFIKSLNHMHLLSEDGSSECDPDVEISFWESEGHKLDPCKVLETKESYKDTYRAINNCKTKWTTLEIEIFDRLNKNQSKQEIAKNLNITVSKVYSIIRAMKNDILIEIR